MRYMSSSERRKKKGGRITRYEKIKREERAVTLSTGKEKEKKVEVLWIVR